jgi:starch phosphorylase
MADRFWWNSDAFRSTVEVWRVHLGRLTLYLMDTEVAENNPADRADGAVYGGDRDHRMGRS